MERLKKSIPSDLRSLILSTTASNLSSSCAALALHFSTESAHFPQLLEQLVNPDLACCAKDPATAANWKRDGNAAFGSQNYNESLSCYTKALRYAPLSSSDQSRVTQATLFVNRAAALHKLGLLQSSMRDCNRALNLYPSYAKAWYRRGRLKFDLSDFHGAVIDMEGALANETTAGGQVQIKRDLVQIEAKAQVFRQKEMVSASLILGKEGVGTSPEVMDIKNFEGIDHIQKAWTKEKGWSLQATTDFPSGSLIIEEDPYAAVVLKQCRDTHCHFCFELLPADPVACSGCAIPFYCSDFCKSSAVDSPTPFKPCLLKEFVKIESKQKDPSGVCGVPLAKSSTDSFQRGTCEPKFEDDLNIPNQRWGGHMLECSGGSWSAVLPTEAVLGARMLFRTSYLKYCRQNTKLTLIKEPELLGEVDTLCSHYENLSPNDKLELHVLGVVIAHCVHASLMPLLETGTQVHDIASKIIGLIAQIRVNAMAIFVMSSPNVDLTSTSSNCTAQYAVKNTILATTPLCTVEQVKVAQGIYLTGSRLNHSCLPNVHASFVYGRLQLRAITDIPRNSMLELCYGPQVGGQSQQERKHELLERYFFNCTCPACSKMTLPDLFLRSLRCAKRSCMGVVLGSESLEMLTITKPKADLGRGAEDKREIFQKSNGSHFIMKHSPGETSIVSEEFAKVGLACGQSIGHCLSCGTVVDIERACEVTRSAVTHLDRIESDLVKPKDDGKHLKAALNGALKALSSLRVTVHAYNEQLAKGEDIVARLLCVLEQPLQALSHCQRSIEILEHLYSKQHIVVSNEHLKLASVALVASDLDCARQSLATADQTLSVHYGSDYGKRFSYVAQLQKMVL